MVIVCADELCWVSSAALTCVLIAVWLTKNNNLACIFHFCCYLSLLLCVCRQQFYVVWKDFQTGESGKGRMTDPVRQTKASVSDELCLSKQIDPDRAEGWWWWQWRIRLIRTWIGNGILRALRPQLLAFSCWQDKKNELCVPFILMGGDSECGIVFISRHNAVNFKADADLWGISCEGEGLSVKQSSLSGNKSLAVL